MLRDEFAADAVHVEDLGLRESRDKEIAGEAQRRNSAVITKDVDFLAMARRGDLPGVVLLTCGNLSNMRLRAIMRANFAKLIELLEAGELVIEVQDETSLA